MTRRDALKLATLITAGGAVLEGSRWPAIAGALQTAQRTPDPWTTAQTLEPASLVKELAGPTAARPTIVCVGVPTLYRAGHVPGASLHGPASTPEGLADLKRWAGSVSRSANVVLYCGCCPWAACPNLRPAFTTLRDMGFTHLRVLMLPNNFGTDWAGKNYPIER